MSEKPAKENEVEVKRPGSRPTEADSLPGKPKYFKEQFEDEETMLVFRKHPIVMRRGIIFASAGLLLAMTPALIKPQYGVFFGGLVGGFLLFVLILFPWWVRWYFSVYIMTDKRFIQQTRSLLQVNVVDIGLEQIQMINYQIAGLEQTMLGFGTIVVQTYVGDLVINEVHHPEKVQKKMVHILRDLGIHHTMRPGTEKDHDQDDEEL
ncbi:PH domain-containing protein [Candidatus Saccharibacteria bacterium]|nr:PH domain-containing protein [Candidatus Saccharibacteria bacterium]